ncbi:MAG: 4-hydroxy-3-methylbut-2-enyl diphosphate reductase [Candidatus Krumholzibacteriota bacterium]
MERKIEILVSPYTGYCFGVKRAMSLLEEGLNRNSGNPVYSAGDIIHNPQAIEQLRSRGVENVKELSDLREGDTFVIRAHGVHPSIIDEVKKKSLKLIDTTCPFVKRSQKYVKILSAENRDIIIIGDRDHPEVKGLSGHAGEKPFIINSLMEAQRLPALSRAGVVIQTTFSARESEAIITELRNRIPDLKVFNTICKATAKRRKATMDIARKVDLMLVVGGKGSSNTKRLHYMCLDNNILSRHIETADEIEESWFTGIKRVGLTTGTSTPDWVLTEVKKKLREISGDC